MAGWLSWLEHHPIHQKVASFIPGQGTYLGFEFDLWLGQVQKATNASCVDVSLSLSQIYKHIFGRGEEEEGKGEEEELALLSRKQKRNLIPAECSLS